MNDVHALSGAYAVDALDDIERAHFERHLSECASCRSEVNSLQEAAALLVETTSIAPPAALRDRVLADVANVRPLPPVVAATERTRSTRRRFPALVAAAAALIAFGGAATTVWHPWSDEDSSVTTANASDRVLNAEDAVRIPKKFDDGSSATVVFSPGLGESVITTQNMPDAPSGYVRQLWYIDADENFVSAGLMPNDPEAIKLLDGDATEAVAVGLTVEPEGGSTEPMGEPIAVFSLENA